MIKNKKKLLIPVLAMVLLIAMTGNAFATSYRLHKCTGNNVYLRRNHFKESDPTSIYGHWNYGDMAYGYNPDSFGYGSGIKWIALKKQPQYSNGWSKYSYFQYINTIY